MSAFVMRTEPDGQLMKSLVLPSLLALAHLIGFAAPSVFAEGPMYDGYGYLPYGQEGYRDKGYGISFDGVDGEYSGSRPAGAGWAPDRYQDPRDWRQRPEMRHEAGWLPDPDGQWRGGGPRAPPLPDVGEGHPRRSDYGADDRRDRPPGFGPTPPVWRNDRAARGNADWNTPSSPRLEYSFRGDDSEERLERGGLSGRDGFRFRPLSEEEQERVGAGYRGWGAPLPGDSPRMRGGAYDVRAEDAYGYQPDAWYRRDYNDRP